MSSEDVSILKTIRLDAVDRHNYTLSRRIESLEEEVASLISDRDENRTVKLFEAKVRELEEDIRRLTGERDALHSSYVKAIDDLDAERRKKL